MKRPYNNGVCRKCGSTEKHRSGVCAPCTRASVNRYRAKHRGQVKLYNIRAKYKGLQIRWPPSATCDICKEPPKGKRPLVLDHCHAADTFRGWLCDGCNHGLGNFRDNPTRMQAAARYVTLHNLKGLL
jgi:hypothetical protein